MFIVRRLPSLLVVICLAAPLAACKKNDACSRLADQVAKGTDVSSDKARDWVVKQMAGPDGKVPSGDQLETTCGMALGDKDLVAGLKQAAKAELKK